MGSEPFINLITFSLCEKKIPKTKVIKTQLLFSMPRGNVKSNEDIADIKDDKEDRLKIRAEISQMRQHKEKSQKFRAPIIPKKVATPFPPLNSR